MSLYKFLLTGTLVSLLIVAEVGAQDRTVIPAFSGSLVLDGHVVEDGWENVDPLPVTGYSPVSGAEPSERTEIRVAHDNTYLYVSCRCFDSDPNGVRIQSLNRDLRKGDDAMQLLLDTFDDDQSGVFFWMTPAGTRGEALVTGDLARAAGFQESWDTLWEGKAVVTENGWSGEFRVPLTNLKYEVNDGVVNMGMVVSRIIGRRNEIVTWPSIEAKWPYLKPSIAANVSMNLPTVRSRSHVTPYVLGGVSRTARQTDDAWTHDAATIREIGGDIKLNVRRNMTLDLTANTDFAQVEADDDLLNLSQYALFLPEKRQFFQEGAGIFDFPLSVGNSLFHSRQIGIDASGNTVPLHAGARLVGRTGMWDVGLLAIQSGTATGGSEHFDVVRFKRSLGSGLSHTGGMITSRLGQRDSRNVTYGLDGTFNVTGNDFVSITWAQTLQDDEAGGRLSDSQAWVSFTRRGAEGFLYAGDVAAAGATFQPGTGFLRFNDYAFSRIDLSYGVFTTDNSWLRYVRPSVLLARRWRLSENAMEAQFGTFWTDYVTKKGARGVVAVRLFHNRVFNAFRIGDAVTIPAGVHTAVDLYVTHNTAPVRNWRSRFVLQVGPFYDGMRKQLLLSPTWNPSRHLEMGVEAEVTDLSFSQRDETLRSHIFRLRLQSALNTRLSASVYMQSNDVSQRATMNGRVRMNFQDGRDLWIVYSDEVNLERTYAGETELPFSDGRQLLVKFTSTFSV